MKKMLLKCLSAVSLIVATSSVFAAPTYNVSVVPTDVALVNHVSAKKATNGVSSDIIVVNYSKSNIVLAYPGPAKMITERTSARIFSSDYSGYATVILQKADGSEFWRSNTVGPFDTISVYVSNDQYVVYDTAN
jgi:hypothetical protein